MRKEVSNQPTEFRLEQNAPNPFHDKTTIRFAVPRAGRVKLLVISRDEKLVHVLCHEDVKAGWHDIDWGGETADGQRFANGSYQYRLEAEGFVATRKLEIKEA